MTITVQNYRFADEPLASDSAQFPLSRGLFVSDDEAPSPVGVRPWNLRGMKLVEFQGEPTQTGQYDHARQIRVDGEGRPLIEMGPPTAKKTGQMDGDEGPVHDWIND